MYRIPLLAMALLLPIASPAALVGHYDFESDPAGSVLDRANPDGTAAPNDNGTIAGNPAYVAGKIGSSALQLSEDSVNLGAQDMLNGASGVTLSAWVRLDALPADIGSIVFLSNGSFSLNSRAVLDIDSSGRVEMGGRALDSETFRSRVTSTTLALNSWYHLAGVIDYSSDTVTIYINGVSQTLLAGTTNFTGAAASNTDSVAASIGATGSSFEYLAATLDEVKIHNTALSALEVAALVPEPTTAALLAAGGAVALRRRRSRARPHPDAS
jgi:hypothetical protein